MNVTIKADPVQIPCRCDRWCGYAHFRPGKPRGYIAGVRVPLVAVRTWNRVWRVFA